MTPARGLDPSSCLSLTCLEFVCLLPGIEAAGLSQLMEQLRVSVESEHLPHGASSASPWVTIT